jgi:uncharacterized protein
VESAIKEILRLWLPFPKPNTLGPFFLFNRTIARQDVPVPADETTWKQFSEKLDAHHTWPCAFVFKCIVPQSQASAARDLLPEGETTSRESQGGKHLSLTCTFPAQDAASVVAVYRRLSQVEGIILL